MDRKADQDYFDWIRKIQSSDQTDIDKLKEFFGQTTAKIIGFAEKEIELARAMQDRETLIKHQIKMETFKGARDIFARGYQIVTGKRAWDDKDRR